MKKKVERKKYHAEWRKSHQERWNAYSAKWYAKNKKKRQLSIARWDRKNKERRRAYNREWKHENKEKIAEKQRTRLLRYKTMVVAAYGGGCFCCREKQVAFLTVEHIKKNGREHRRQVGGNFYNYLVKNNFPKEDLCILCMNCNWAERNGWPCPHKKSLLAKGIPITARL